MVVEMRGGVGSGMRLDTLALAEATAVPEACTCSDMRADICVDTCLDMRLDVCLDTCLDMRLDMCFGHVFRHVHRQACACTSQTRAVVRTCAFASSSSRAHTCRGGALEHMCRHGSRLVKKMRAGKMVLPDRRSEGASA